MKTEELLAIEQAMTPGTWWLSVQSEQLVAYPPGDAAVMVAHNHFSTGDSIGVVTLRNHARALIDLVAAVGRRRNTRCYSVSVHEPERAMECQCSALYAPECPIRAADKAVLTAHAAVEAIK